MGSKADPQPVGVPLTGLNAVLSSGAWVGFWDGVASALPGTPYPYTGTGPTFPPVEIEGQKNGELSQDPSFTYGKPVGGFFTPVPDADEARVGDTYRFTYRLSIPYLPEWQSKALVSKLLLDDRFALKHASLNEETRTLRVEIVVEKTSSPVVILAIGLAAVLVGFGIYMAVGSIEKLVTVTGAQASKIGGELLIPALIGVGAILFLWKRRHR